MAYCKISADERKRKMALIVAGRQAGKPVKVIARELACSPDSVKYFLEITEGKRDVQGRYHRSFIVRKVIPPETAQYVIAARRHCQSIKTIARDVEMTPNQVKHLLAHNGVKLPTNASVSDKYIRTAAAASVAREIDEAQAEAQRFPDYKNGQGRLLEW
jgi:hypothetical protein